MYIEDFPNLHSITRNIHDINTLLVPRLHIQEMRKHIKDAKSAEDIKSLIDSFQKLNMSNFSAGDVARLNTWVLHIVQALRK